MVIGVRQLNLTVDVIAVSQIDKFQIDWTKEFINEIYAVDASESCKDQDEPVLQMPWFGLQHLCLDNKGRMVPGKTCWESQLLYMSENPDTGEFYNERMRSKFNDIVGFPMV